MGSLRDQGWVYFLRPVGQDGPIKIGFSTCPSARLAQYQWWSPVPLVLVAEIEATPLLERQLHAKFRAHHSHHEWFTAAPELVAFIETARRGAPDLSDLPGPSDVRLRRPRKPEASQAAGYKMRLAAMKRRGVPIPPEVERATYTYRLPPAEIARRREIIRAFVDSVRLAESA